MKKVLVTGASGFLGSHVADELTNRGFEVTLFDINDSPYKQGSQKMVVGNLSDFDLLKQITKNVDYVFHFAGLADIYDCMEKPQETITTNILGTVNLLETCRLNKIKRFVFASSVYVFSNQGGFYRSSKRACESYIDDYKKTYGLDFTILRYGSLYGERVLSNNRLGKILCAFIEQKELQLSGKDSDVREYLHVRDAAKLTVDMLDDKYQNTRITISGPERYTMRELIELTKEITGKNIEIVFDQIEKFQYSATPYNYNIEESLKVIANPYIEMGQGITKLLEHLKYGK